jgi:hypothetical protein
LAWLGLAWLGLAWLGLAWLGLAWLGLAWLGLVVCVTVQKLESGVALYVGVPTHVYNEIHVLLSTLTIEYIYQLY